jgi:serine/threonine protein kinase
MDWGIARRLDGAPRRHVVGTPAYLAPELLDLTMALGPWTDVYAAGACLHEVLTGHPPHRGGSLADVLRSVHAAEPPAPR